MSVKWLLVDIGDVLLLKTKRDDFNELLAGVLNIDIDLAREINKAHYTAMDIKYVSESDFITDLKNKLNYKAPENIFTYFRQAYEKQVRPNTELFNYLDMVQELEVKTAILSNTIAIYQPLQEQMGINEENRFSPIIYSWREELVKPDKKILSKEL